MERTNLLDDQVDGFDSVSSVDDVEIRRIEAEITKGFEIVIDTFQHNLDLNSPENFFHSICLYHKQIFKAACYPQWCDRNFNGSRDTDYHRNITRPLPIDDMRERYIQANLRLKEVILHRLIWMVSEQIRHCPQRINSLYHQFRTSMDNEEYFSVDSIGIDIVGRLYRFFRMEEYVEIRPDFEEEDCEAFLADVTGNHMIGEALVPFNYEDLENHYIFPPRINVSEVKTGIQQFIENKDGLNFDDIDEKGKWNDNNDLTSKTFNEAGGSMLFFIIFKFSSGMAQFKFWCISFIFFWGTYNRLFPFRSFLDNPHSPYKPALCRESSSPELNALFPNGICLYPVSAFLIVDYLLVLTMFILDISLRMCITVDRRWANSDKFLILRQLMDPLFLIVVPILLVVLSTAIGTEQIVNYNDMDLGLLDKIWVFLVMEDNILFIAYGGARLLAATIPQFFPYSPKIKKRTKEVKLAKGFAGKTKRKRALSRIGFMVFLTVLTLLYEKFFIVRTIEGVINFEYCRSTKFPNVLTYNSTLEGFTRMPSYLETQTIICYFTTAVIWFNTIIAVAMDNGLAFVVIMSLLGWIRGYRTQGSSRSNYAINKSDLLPLLEKRFLSCQRARSLPYENDKLIAPEVFTGEKEIPNINTRANSLWEFCVDYWRSLDLISNEEQNYMKKSGTIDTSMIADSEAVKHISFWLSSLTTEPKINTTFYDIPSVTVLIPTYAETFEFKWVEKLDKDPKAEFAVLVSKFSHSWLNFLERIGQEASSTDIPLEKLIMNLNLENEMENGTYSTLNGENSGKMDREYVIPKDVFDAVTEWLSTQDQYVRKTIKGACSYYDALVELGVHEIGLDREYARTWAKKKVQVILAVQTYQSRYYELAPIVAKWMEEFPCLNIVINFERPSKLEDQQKLPEEFKRELSEYEYASALLAWDDNEDRVVYKRVLPRKYVLRIKDGEGRAVQGKSMNQVYGMTFAFGQFVQVLDSNQGAHATEYMKLPALLRSFQLNQAGEVRHRIIGSREYIFTKNLGTVARCHAYQEWSFGTLVLRAYSDLGIRLHYGHPDVFHGAWATAHSGLSKVNPNINLSEDVFAGLEALQCAENTKHVEHIEFQKGRETGLANMSAFDSKISQGNPGIMRSRDMFYLMERLDFITGFLMFHGLCGHFVTIALMMISVKWYLYTLLLLSLGGASLKTYGDLAFGSEWFFHAGYTTAIPLVVEFLVEYGVISGIVNTLFFLPISTIIYMFQMQTKFFSFAKSFFTGKGAYIATGRGLSIYRYSNVKLFKAYAETHFLPAFNILALIIAYKSVSTGLNGGTLPLYTIYFLVISMILTPQLFNPTFRGNSILELGADFIAFVNWIGKGEPTQTFQSWKDPGKNSFEGYFIHADNASQASSVKQALRFAFFHFLSLVFWFCVTTFVIYPQMQLWVLFYLLFWSISVIVQLIIYVSLIQYEQPIRIIVIYISIPTTMIVLAWQLYNSGNFNFVNAYIPALITAKILEQVRGLALDFVVLWAYYHRPRLLSILPPLKTTKKVAVTDSELENMTPLEREAVKGNCREVEKSEDEIHAEENDRWNKQRAKFILYYLQFYNRLFLVDTARSGVAICWVIVNAALSLILRPFIGNLLLFGVNANSLSRFRYLKPKRYIRERGKRIKK
eukprot:TRINITY_DN618_c0_g2_i1.p1 TRINITY_DN618_c0_g2~~TRINITY_DN618_c0_g2_i1.p1  ORF type:complete len:1648 (-),score=328.92 TRINITY_DN618_c0_g2_i1:31-4974(-)